MMDERDQLIEELRATIQSMSDTIEKLTASNESLAATITELQETIKELHRQLDQNSQNSSKPPSSDGHHKPSPKSQRTKTGRKPGGQKGHRGSNMSIPHAPDEVIKHLPEKCKTCLHLTKVSE